MRIQELFNKALQDTQSARFAAAEKKLRRILREPLSDRHSATVRELLGVVYASQGDYKAAIKSLTEAAARNPADASIASNLSNCLREAGQIDEAVATGRKAVALNPGLAAAQNNLGNALNARGDLDGAVTAYRQALLIQPDFLEANNNLGLVLQAMGDLEGGIENYRRALRINPAFAEAHKNLGEALDEKGDLDLAEACYQELVDMHPGHAALHNTLGIILQEKHDMDGAVRHYEKALAINPELLEARNNLGAVLYAKEDYAAAIDNCRKVLELNPAFAAAHENLGAIYSTLGQYEDAIRSNDLADSLQSRAESLLCLYALGRYDEFDRRVAGHLERDRLNIHIAAACAFVASQTGRENLHPFCPRPLEFVNVGTIRDRVDDLDCFLDGIASELTDISGVWEPLSRTTRHGFQTHGNLFRKGKPLLARPETIISAEIAAYRAKFGGCLLLEAWPEKTEMTGWSVRLHRNCHQSAHIHPTGWLSGVIYLELLEAPDPAEGAIEFGLDCPGYPVLNDASQCLCHHPKWGDIVLFPSSLYHHTIPIRQDGVRLTISFDLMPV